MNMKLNNIAADDCFGLVSIGGDVHNEIANINAIGWGSFSALDWIKDDVNGGVSKSFLGMTWTLNANNGANDSTYTLTVVDDDPGTPPDLPFYVDIVGFLKAGTPGAFYFFDDRLIDTSNDGTFTIVWTVGNGNNPGLSGLTLFIRESDLPPPCVDCFNIEAPEPGSLALMGVGIVALAALRRRRSR